MNFVNRTVSYAETFTTAAANLSIRLAAINLLNKHGKYIPRSWLMMLLFCNNTVLNETMNDCNFPNWGTTYFFITLLIVSCISNTSSWKIFHSKTCKSTLQTSFKEYLLRFLFGNLLLQDFMKRLNFSNP